MTRGQAFDDILRLKEFRRLKHDKHRSLGASGVNGGAGALVSVDALCAVGSSAVVVSPLGAFDDFSHSMALADAFFLLIASLSFSASPDTCSLVIDESCVLFDHLLFVAPSSLAALHAVPHASFHLFFCFF